MARLTPDEYPHLTELTLDTSYSPATTTAMNSDSDST